MLTPKALETFQTKPHLFFKEVLGAECEAYQEKILGIAAKESRISVSSAHDTGKSWLMARVVLWYLYCFPYSKVITTAPTFNQVKNILWSEIRSAHSKAKFNLGGNLLQTELQVTEKGDWFALGFTPKNEIVAGEGQGTQSTFQGFHAPHLLVVFDEATGIPFNIWTMAEGLLTSANVKFVAIGNPTSKNSQFFKCFLSPSWAKIKLSCFDSPNLKANGVVHMHALRAEYDVLTLLSDDEKRERMNRYVVVRPYLLTLKWVMERAIEWGLTHPLFVSKCLGEFPDEGENVAIPLGTVEAAQTREAIILPSDRRSLGIDVARFGVDSTVFTYLHGNKFLGKKVLTKRDTMAVSGEAINFCREHGWPDVLTVDETGLGAGVVDALREAQNDRKIPGNIEIRGVQFGAACENDIDRERFVNIKARMFDLLAKDLKAGLCLPDEAVYLEELPTIIYAFDSKGRMAIESKDLYKKRTGRSSPDHADSLALANYGRYDSLTVGSFTEEFTKSAQPMTAPLSATTKW